MPSLIEIGAVVLEKKMNIRKVNDNAIDNANDNDDNDGQLTNG